MITTGIIKEVNVSGEGYNSNLCLVELPIFNSSSNLTYHKTELNATLCLPGGINDAYHIGDLVYVGFIDNKYNYPLILGKIYRGLDTEASGAYNITSLKVSDQTNLSENTTIGDITYGDLLKIKVATSEILSNYVTLNTEQIITATKTFKDGFKIGSVDSKKIVGTWNDEFIFEDDIIFENVQFNIDNSTYTTSVSALNTSINSAIIPKYYKENDIWYKVTSISNDAFFNCTLLTNIIIPDSITSIGREAFGLCSSLTNITIPTSVTSIGSEAFSYCSGLTNITIPNSVTSIEDSTFYNCGNLTNITIPDSVVIIKNYAFAGTGIYGIRISDSVTVLGNGVFFNCSNLGYGNDVILGKGITTIGDYTFDNCTNLGRIAIPTSITAIQSYAFRGCANLRSIHILKDDNSVISGAPWGATNATVIYNRSINVSGSSIATKDFSFAGGFSTTAGGEGAYAIGYHTTALGEYSHAEGSNTHASKLYQHVLGEYNIIDAESDPLNRGTGYGRYIEIVGNGNYSQRNNARTLDWDGNEVLAGTLTSNGTWANSDIKLKENIKDWTPKKSILSLPIKEFDFIKDKSHHIGCLAQDLQEICPEIVHENNDGYLTIEESKLIYLLLDEVKKLKQEVEDLKSNNN